MALEPGFILNQRYRILTILGQGGMGNVYQALDLNLSVDVAVKENLYLTDEYTRQFKREAALLATLRHPNLTKVFDHFEIPGQGQYLVMEFITGEDLRERMDRLYTLPEDEVIHIGSAICDALAYLHSRNPAVLHRDIKPGNVRISDEGHVYLVDFGLAKLQLGGQETTSGARAMTPGYSPPEQYGSARTDTRSDIYALGATLYAALCGAAPEDSLSRATDFTKLTPLRTQNPKVSRKMASVIEKALELKPEDRYQTADDMKAALLGIIGERPVSRPITITPPPAGPMIAHFGPDEPIRPPTNRPISHPTTPPLQPTGRNYFPVILITALVMIVIVAATAFLLSRAGIILQMTQVSPPATATQPTTNPALGNSANTIRLQTVFANTPSPVSSISTPATQNSSINGTTLPLLTPATTSTLSRVPTSIPNTNTLGQIAYVSNRTGLPQVWMIDSNGSNQHQITNLKEGACQPDWSPDGQKIVFISPCSKRDTRYPKGNLFTMNIDGTNLVALDAGYGSNYDPDWSPDGIKIAYTKEISMFTQVFVLDLTNGKITAAIDDKLASKQPSWSPDGKLLAYILTKYSTDQVWILDLTSKAVFQLSHDQTRNDSRPCWSPDGKTIYFTQSPLDQFIPEMAAIAYDPQGKTKEYSFPLANHPVPSPAGDEDISPDGDWVVFESWPEGGNHDIYIMTIEGDSVLRLTNDHKVDFQPAWRPLAP
jgi:eukaryotic-like serine/threonine-protein kinase